MYAPAFKVGVNIFSISFILGVIVMVMALITKEWSMDEVGNRKYDFLIYQYDVHETKCVLPVQFRYIFVYEHLYGFLDLFKATALIFTPFMLIAGIRLRKIHESTKQPEYYRWSNRVITGCLFALYVSCTRSMAIC